MILQKAMKNQIEKLLRNCKQKHLLNVEAEN